MIIFPSHPCRWFQGFDWEALDQQTLRPPIVPQVIPRSMLWNIWKLIYPSIYLLLLILSCFSFKVSSPTDMSNFDTCSKEEDMTSTELSLWEADF